MTTRGASRRRRAAAVVATAVALLVVSGCVADPPPPTVVGEDRTDGAPVSLSGGGVLLALDRVDPGFNPHLLANQGVDTDLVASLLLPSAFVRGADGEPVLNRALLVSAEPLAGATATIRYTIHPKAQWSDGVPVAAEDFEYLWRQMTTQPGVVDPAGYERIVAVRSGAGGKVVDVVFDTPTEQWRDLFSNLLPGHILKDAPDGFQGAMASLPVMSAGPFMIRDADIGRGVIEFVRNDRYWAQAPEPDQIVVRRATGAGQVGAALRDGPGSMALVPATPVAADVAATVPGVRSVRSVEAAQLELALNTVAPSAGQIAVRRAIAAAIDPTTVGRIVTGESTPATTNFPFPTGSATTPTGGADVVERELAAAGYTRPGKRWERAATPLSITLGVEAADERALTAAYTVADQLRGRGIGARVWELDPVALYADALPHGLIDGVVGWQRADGSAEVAATSRFACTATAEATEKTDVSTTAEESSDTGASATTGSVTLTRPRTTVSSLIPPEPDSGESPATDRTTATTTAGTTPTRTVGVDSPARAADVSGLCDSALDRALGVGGGATDLSTAAELVAEQAVRIPLVRPTLLLSENGVDGVRSGRGRPDSGADRPRGVTDIFGTAPTWRRIG
ncbi:ABC transporter substrate-binding protein [Dietzia alimentaria]|uniref:ABC transporter substrate-binding protein n=1 Tax=Dietzia alimentaria TaxID=665550 RepID=UPI00067FD0CD|nr:ABC transporter substrate-binding protein [Dietzia alimentaria]